MESGQRNDQKSNESTLSTPLDSTFSNCFTNKNPIFFFFFGTNNTQIWSHIGKIINGGKKSNWFVGLQKPTPFDIETEGSLDEQLCFWSPNNIEH